MPTRRPTERQVHNSKQKPITINTIQKGQNIEGRVMQLRREIGELKARTAHPTFTPKLKQLEERIYKITNELATRKPTEQDIMEINDIAEIRQRIFNTIHGLPEVPKQTIKYRIVLEPKTPAQKAPKPILGKSQSETPKRNPNELRNADDIFDDANSIIREARQLRKAPETTELAQEKFEQAISLLKENGLVNAAQSIVSSWNNPKQLKKPAKP
ncbi:MAG: hypothetical protein Q7K42_04345 [Candidatus Diapherotrites archaeon]|nr:hypothetical protein [Candidatus Diapherotrites archaeon]